MLSLVINGLVIRVVVDLNRRDLMFSLKDNEITTSNIENIISSR